MALTRHDLTTPLADGLDVAFYRDSSSKLWQPALLVAVGPDGEPTPVACDGDGALV